jgi:hypothetical protein
VLTVPKVLWRGEAVEPLSEGVGVVVEGLWGVGLASVKM